MSNYHAMDEDDTLGIIVDGIEALGKCTRRLNAKIGLMEQRDSPALRAQIESEHKKGQDIIAEVKAELRSAGGSNQVRQAEREFRTACTDFKQAFADYRNGGSSGASIASGDSSELHPAASQRFDRGSQQSLKMVMESDDVEAIMARENREDAKKLASDTAAILDTMVDINGMIEADGEALVQIDDEIEDAAEVTEQAAEELAKAREHQKSSIKIKLAIGICCGVVVIVAVVVLLQQLGVFKGGGGSGGGGSNLTLTVP